MLEAARGAAQMLADESKANAGVVALTAASIPAPLILPHGDGAPMPAVRCTVHSSLGAAPLAQLQSRTNNGAATTHLAAGLAAPAQLAAACSASAPGGSTGTLLSVLLSPSATTRAHHTTACGSIFLEEQQQAGPGYFCHPAAVDATLHLGLYADLAQGGGGPGAPAGGDPRVPVAAAFFTAPSAEGCGGAWAPAMHCESFTASATVASYELRSSSTPTTPAFLLAQLQSKAVRSTPKERGAPAAALEEAPLTCYCAEWRAAAPAVQSLERGALHSSAPEVLLSSSHGRLALLSSLTAGCAARAVFEASQRALRYLQRAELPGSLVLEATTAGAVVPVPVGAPRLLARALAVQAVQGMLKVAVAERAAGALLPGCRLYDVLQPARHHELSDSLGNTDVHAASNAQLGVWFLPTLQRTKLTAATPTPPFARLSGATVVIGGGLGALGLLMAAWAGAAMRPARVQLWGRTASAALPSALTGGSTLLSATQGDAAAAADGWGAADRTTSIYMHAGKCGGGGAAAGLPSPWLVMLMS